MALSIEGVDFAYGSPTFIVSGHGHVYGERIEGLRGR